MSEQTTFIKRIASRLAAAGLDYMITGSMAMVFDATPRMTRDLDLVVHLPEERIPSHSTASISMPGP